MLAILRQFQSYDINFPSHYTEDSMALSLVNTDVNWEALIEGHKWLAVQYSTHCVQLMASLNCHANEVDLKKQIEAALMMSVLLEHIYTCYLYETDAIKLMGRHQFIYRNMLRDRGLRLLALSSPDDKPSFSKKIHEIFTTGNRRRLCTVRVRRLLIAAIPLASEFTNYCLWVSWMEQMTAPVVIHLAWMTLSPRLLKNLVLILKHLVPHSSWMTREESSLEWKTRLIAQLELHWFELANDIATVSVGLLNCFVLVGSANIYLGFSLFIFDVALACLRAYFDNRDLKRLEARYQAMPLKTSIDAEYLVHLKARIIYEETRLNIMIKNTLGLLLAAALSLPIMAIHPIIPFLGGLIAVLTTILNMMATQHVEKLKPDDKITYTPKFSVNRNALFQPSVVNESGVYSNGVSDASNGLH